MRFDSYEMVDGAVKLAIERGTDELSALKIVFSGAWGIGIQHIEEVWEGTDHDLDKTIETFSKHGPTLEKTAKWIAHQINKQLGE